MPITSMPTTVRRNGSSRRESRKAPLAELASQAKTLLGAIDAVAEPAAEMERLRHHYLERQLAAVAARIRMLKGERLSFDEESRALYDAVAPTLPGVALSEDPRRSSTRSSPATVRWSPRYEEFRSALRDPARQARRGLPGGDQGMPRAYAAAREAARSPSSSPSSTSPTSRGAATTGIRATSAA